jgi:hypothetical protein
VRSKKAIGAWNSDSTRELWNLTLALKAPIVRKLPHINVLRTKIEENAFFFIKFCKILTNAKLEDAVATQIPDVFTGGTGSCSIPLVHFGCPACQPNISQGVEEAHTNENSGNEPYCIEPTKCVAILLVNAP